MNQFFQTLVFIFLINLVVFIKFKFPSRLSVKQALFFSMSFSAILLVDAINDYYDLEIESIYFKVASVVWLIVLFIAGMKVLFFKNDCIRQSEEKSIKSTSRNVKN